MLPENLDLKIVGRSTQALIDLLTSASGIIPRRRATWIVRWKGRVRTIDGVTIFSSRDEAITAVKLWLRKAIRLITSRWWSHGQRNDNSEITILPLPENWGYKKIYRDFVDRLVDYMISIGLFSFQEIDPEEGTPNALLS